MGQTVTLRMATCEVQAENSLQTELYGAKETARDPYQFFRLICLRQDLVVIIDPLSIGFVFSHSVCLTTEVAKIRLILEYEHCGKQKTVKRA